jgi:hypothetical protein
MSHHPDGSGHEGRKGNPPVFVSSSVDSSVTMIGGGPADDQIRPAPGLSRRSLRDPEKGEDQPGGKTDLGRHTDAPDGGADSAPRRSSLGAILRKRFGPGGKLQPFRLLATDFHNVRHRWVSDWTVFNQLVLASAVYVFFTNILPGITFASDLYVLTGKSWGTIEVVFSTGLCGLIFSLWVSSHLISPPRLEDALLTPHHSFSAQPLTILGVTGPFSVLAENIYHLCTHSFHVRIPILPPVRPSRWALTIRQVSFLPVMAWSLIHAGWMHYLLAIFNAHDWTMQYVTHFSADIFSLLNSVIYFHKAALELKRTHDNVSMAAFLYAVIGAVGTCIFAIFLSTAPSWKPLLHRYIRLGLSEYAAAISFIGLPHIGELTELDHQWLMVQPDFRPSSPGRSVFFVEFWKVPVEWVFISIIPGAVITTFFYFDHEISSIICTSGRYRVKKPGGFAWDIALLGTTTILCGIMGIPPANGLLPQAPLHSESLLHVEDEPSSSEPEPEQDFELSPNRKASFVYEQRYSHFLQAAMILIFITPPFQRLLGLTPTSVLAGLFMFMGYQSLSVNPLLQRVGYLLTPPSELRRLPEGVTWLGVHTYTASQVVITGIIFGVTLTVAALCFPVLVIILVPIRLFVMNRIWSRETLKFVDGWACREGKPEDRPGDRTSPNELLAVEHEK